jgi:hypothetical protein
MQTSSLQVGNTYKLAVVLACLNRHVYKFKSPIHLQVDHCFVLS